jgi:hypothetical protein
MTTDQRLARVERQNAQMKVALAGMAVVLAVVLLVAAGQDQDKPKVLEEVRAKKFVLVDNAGNPRASLFLDKNRSPSLHFRDEDGHKRMDLGVTKDGPGLILIDKSGKPRASLWSIPSRGGPHFFMWDPEGGLIFQAPK